jgi:hypothetical protein
MQYKIIEGLYPTQLEEEVNKYLASGWTLQGGVSISRSRFHSGVGGTDLVYVQAMFKINP